MGSISFIGFKFLSGHGFYVQGHCDFDLWPTQKSIAIIYWSWSTKTLIMVLLSLISFKLLSGQGLYVQCHCDLDLWPTDLESIGHGKLIIYWRLGPNLGEISLKLMSGLDYTNAGRTDGRTDRQTDDMHRNIIRPKVPFGV